MSAFPNPKHPRLHSQAVSSTDGAKWRQMKTGFRLLELENWLAMSAAPSTMVHTASLALSLSLLLRRKFHLGGQDLHSREGRSQTPFRCLKSS